MTTIRKIKINDSDALRQRLDDLYEQATQIVMAEWALGLAEYIMQKSKYNDSCSQLIAHGFAANRAWQKGQARMHDVRQAGFKIHKLAKETDNELFKTVLRVVGQAVGTGHMKEHAMVASDYAIKVINILYPNDQTAVEKERKRQIEALQLLIEI